MLNSCPLVAPDGHTHTRPFLNIILKLSLNVVNWANFWRLKRGRGVVAECLEKSFLLRSQAVGGASSYQTKKGY